MRLRNRRKSGRGQQARPGEHAVKPLLRLYAATFLILVLIFGYAPVLNVAATQDSWPNPLSIQWPTLEEIKTPSYIVIERDSGKVLLEKNARQPMYPASLTKIMTGLLILESGPLDRSTTVSRRAVTLPAGSSKVGLLRGEIVNLHDLAAALMLVSGNDAANALAEATAGSIEAFVERMNRKASALGLNATYFRNPSGLQHPQHVTTAADIARLTAQAMKVDAFRSLVGTKTYTMPTTNVHKNPCWGLLFNTNRSLFFDQSAFSSDQIVRYTGVKTGTTDAAGKNLVSSVLLRDGRELIAVQLGDPIDDTASIFAYAHVLLETATRRLLGLSSATPAPTPTKAPPAVTSADPILPQPTSATTAVDTIRTTPGTSDTSVGVPGITGWTTAGVGTAPSTAATADTDTTGPSAGKPDNGTVSGHQTIHTGNPPGGGLAVDPSTSADPGENSWRTLFWLMVGLFGVLFVCLLWLINRMGSRRHSRLRSRGRQTIAGRTQRRPDR